MKTWQADVELGVTQCHAIIVDQFPQFASQSLRILGQGWDNICVQYENDTLFRLPTRTVGGRLIKLEIQCLPQLVGKVPLAIPELQFVGHPTDDYPYHFVGYQKVPGDTADRLDWTGEARKGAATKMGEFLRALHTVTIDSEGVPREPFDETMIRRPRERLAVRRDFVVEIQPEKRRWTHDLFDFAESLCDQLTGEDDLVLVHGDLYPRHILADENLRVTGIIDWGDIHIAHPALDLSIATTFLEPEERPDFWAAYGLPVTENSQHLAHVKSTVYAMAIYGYGLSIGDEAMVHLGETIARRIL